MTATAEAASEQAALEQLHSTGRTDGLPVIVPTRVRVDDMVLAGGLAPDLMMGRVGPSMAAATVETIAVNAVMAGCSPEHFPVVLAAVQAICAEEFDLTEVQVTTHAVTPMIIVNGPARDACGVASGSGALGPGARANATIGRALRLVMINIGGGRAGISDMALFGHPAKFTFCLAEAEEASPWPPLHVSRGWSPDHSTVTVVGVEGPHSVVCAPMPDEHAARAADATVAQLARAVGATSANSTFHQRGHVVVLINPAIARLLAAAGLDRQSLQRRLVDECRHPRRLLRALNPALVDEGDDDDLLPVLDPATLLIVVAGGEGAYCLVCPSVGVGPHRNQAVTAEIQISQYCELPAGLDG